MSKSYDKTFIEVLNWEKFNVRSDIKKQTWFRINNDMALGPQFFGLNSDQKWLWIVILSLVSIKNGEKILWNAAYIKQVTGISEDDQNSAIEIFEEFGFLCCSRTRSKSHPNGSVRIRNESVTNPCLHTYIHTDKQTNSDTTHTATSGCSPVIASLADPLIDEVLKSVKPEIIDAWLKLYNDDAWVKRELQQAVVWCRANPSRKPKSDYGRFFTKWLSRSWERHRKTLQSNPSKANINWEEVFSEQ